MTVRLAYLTTPAPGVYVLNVQPDDEHELLRFVISKAHLANIIIDGTSLALRESSNRVSETENGDARERSGAQQPRTA